MEGLSLTRLADDLMAQARATPSGRAARTILGDSAHSLRHTAMALAEGRGLAEHTSPGEATLLVLSGRVQLQTAAEVVEASAGMLIPIPSTPHALLAIEDATMLLTVVVK